MKKPFIKRIFFGVFGCYVFFYGILFMFEGMGLLDNRRQLPSTDMENYQKPSYKFNDPEVAYQILSQLELVDEKAKDDFKPERGYAAIPVLNLKTDDNYCNKRRAYVSAYPESIFEGITFLSDLNASTLVRKKFLVQVGHDVQPYIGFHMPKNDTNVYDIDPSVTTFFSRKSMFYAKKIGKHFSCISQVSNHIAGKLVLDRKYLLTEHLMSYAKKFEDKPQCFNYNKFFPNTYLLYKKESCQEFFNILNSPQYQDMKKEKNIVFLKKEGQDLHMGAGVFPIDDAEESKLRVTYGNGAKCGEIKDLDLIQNFIHKPLLIYGRKFDFRMYMFVASTNPLIAYYHDGSLRVSLMPYSTDTSDKRTLLTNIALNREIYEDAKGGVLYSGMDENELKLAQQWTFTRFMDYMLETGIVKDRSWFDDYLRPEFKKAMIHLLRFGLVSPLKSSTLYLLYGCDFMLDSDLNLWFIEANSAPGMDRLSEPVENFLLKLLSDEMEIVMGLLRSRMKRVINYVNDMMVNGSISRDEQGKVHIKNLKVHRERFAKITENYFEEEFKPSPDNGFKKIIDGNLKEADMYMGFVNEECV